MHKIGKLILKFIASCLFVSNKEKFIKKFGYKIIKIILLLYSLLPFKKNSYFFKITGSDKYEQYSELYNLLDVLKKKNASMNILEIGIGGHNKKYSGGQSLLALKYIYKNSNIIGFDYEDKTFLKDNRIKVYQGDQSNIKDLKNITNDFDKFDIIIDDGSHFANHQLITFDYLFHFLNDDGIYIIEDIQGSYTKCMNGDPELSSEKNLISYFSSFAHCVNQRFILDKFKAKYQKYFEFNKMFFIENAILFQKKNIEKLSIKYPEDELFLSLNDINKKRSKLIKNASGVIDQNS
jgi:hypothetical protein